MVTGLKLIPSDGFNIQMSGRVRIPPIRGWSIQLMSSKKDHVLVSALSDQQLLLYGFEPIFSL
jgi:hypothetical protein